jgi:hypothetical protein
MKIVECLSSSSYPERPVALHWAGERLEIEAILSQWRTPEERWFRVQTRDQRIFELTYEEIGEGWRIHPIPGG